MSAPGTAGSPTQWPEHIRARYGITDRPRWAPLALAALTIAFLVVVTALGWRLSNPAIDAGMLAYDTIADDRIDVRFEVHRRSDSPATCVVRARAPDGFDVGYAQIDLPVATGRTVHEYSLRTAYRALVAELLGCGLAGPPPGISGAQFRPGVVPPEQPWSP